MVKHLAIDLDNDLYDKLINVKDKRTWEKFFQDIVAGEKVFQKIGNIVERKKERKGSKK